MKPKEIWLVSLDDTIGHEEVGSRPAIVISTHDQTKLCTIVPFTKHAEASRFPYTHQIERSRQNGLSCDSVAMIFQIRSLAFERFTRKLGILEETHFQQILILLKKHLNL